ncbi:MAG: RHE_PE00001 family protein [Hyphomicrobium sp.]
MPAYDLSTIDWSILAGPVAHAEDTLARIDERLLKSPIQEGWVSRSHFMDARDALWIDGETLHLEDLVLHDAGMDVRAPTHELTRAHAMLRSRRKIDRFKAQGPLSVDQVLFLVGRRSTIADNADADGRSGETDEYASSDEHELTSALDQADLAVERSSDTLRNLAMAERRRDDMIYDPDWDEDSRLVAWLHVVRQTDTLPPTLAAAVSLDAWDEIDPLQHANGIGRLLAPTILKVRRKTTAHLATMNIGLRTIPRELRRSRDRTVRYAAYLEAITAAARLGLKNHDGWMTSKTLLERKLKGRRSTSRLPALIDLILSKPLVTTPMIATELRVSQRAAQDLVNELGVREMTGRGRFRAWGID